jgi:serine phosphatase RsbU (regulator of sigma subunit)
VVLPSDDAGLVRTCTRLAALTGELVVSRSQYGDAIMVSRRTERLSLAAELRWALLPPLTFETHGINLAGILEPAYSVAGDTFDYSVDVSTAHVAVFDAMGHGLEAARIANLVVGAYRHARRAGLDLVATYEAACDAVAEQFDPSRFCTAILAQLDVGTGELRLLLAGHPPPLLLRNHQVVGDLSCRPTTPIGLRDHDPLVATFQLEPDDRVVLYTDGVVEARRPNGDDFGLDRLADFLVRAELSGEPAAETMRRLAKAVLAHQEGRLQDDATLLMAHWRP